MTSVFYLKQGYSLRSLIQNSDRQIFSVFSDSQFQSNSLLLQPAGTAELILLVQAMTSDLHRWEKKAVPAPTSARWVALPCTGAKKCCGCGTSAGMQEPHWTSTHPASQLWYSGDVPHLYVMKTRWNKFSWWPKQRNVQFVNLTCISVCLI